MQGSHDSGTAAPERRDLDPAALSLLQHHGAEIMRAARRYAASPEDAEDAFQRAFEILLTSAPPGVDEIDLVPWLKTVVKHEAYALHRARERQAPITGNGRPVEERTPPCATHEQAESRERGLQGAEALARLKPQEVRALVLKARGLSYREIGELESWSYTKVNRLLTEGRRAFRRRLAGIQAGVECERMEPLLSLLADGEANADQLATLRPHLKTCLTCRARLREFRSTPQDVAALAPAAGGGGDGGRLRTFVEGLLGLAQGKSAAMAERAHALTEMATGAKIAAVAASAVAVAGGGAAVEEAGRGPAAPPAPVPVVEAQERADALAMKEEPLIESTPAPDASTESPSGAPTEPEPAAAEPRREPAPDPANEFDPSAAAAADQAAPADPQRFSEPGASSLDAVAPGTGSTGSSGSTPGGSTSGGPGGAPGGGSSPSGSSEFAP